MTMSQRWAKYRLGGCLLEETPSPAPVLSFSGGAGGQPQTVDLRSDCSAVEDQDTTQSCAANAVVGAIECMRNRSKMPSMELSRLFVYYNARKLSDRQAFDEGTFMHHVMAATLAFGVCEERMWPFQLAIVTEEPTRACYSNATRYESVQFARMASFDTVLATLAAGLPVVFGAFFPAHYYIDAAERALMPEPAKTPEERGGGHAMLIVGHDLPSRTFLVRNSYGPGFGEGGYFRIPFATMASFSRIQDFWAIGALSTHRGATVGGVPVAAAVAATQAHARAQVAGRAAVSVLRPESKLRDLLTDDLEKAKKGFRDRLRGPGLGGGY
jgi:Papain family cysteine protease